MTDTNMEQFDAEELSVRVGDIDDFRLTRPVLRERVEDIVQENLRYRQAFREQDFTDINSNSVRIPVQDDSMDNPKVVGEGSEFPRDQETYSNKTMEFDKYGFEVAITMEAQQDSMLDLVNDQVNKMARQMAEEMNDRAFDELTGPNGISTTVGDADSVMTYEDLRNARRELRNKNYNPDLLIADVDAGFDLLGSNNFLEATEEQSDMRRSGVIGEILSMTVVEADDDNNITGNSNPGAIMVDTDFYGYEGVRMDTTTEEYGEDRTQSDVFRIFNRMGWLTMQPDAGVIVEG